MIDQLLKQYWNYDNFRPLQRPIIEAVLEKHDVLALLPTGGGKSVCFQVPALAQDGVCIVISPLIALMKDQVEQLQKRNIAAVAIFSGMKAQEIDILLDNCVFGKIKFLYVSPERLQTVLFKERVKRMKVCLLVVDEAHCISQWGSDFRPPYSEIRNFRELLPNVPCIALTATATPDVRKDIQEKLNFKNQKVFEKSFARENLSYNVRFTEDKLGKLLEILTKIRASGIVYVASRRKTKEISDFLQKNNINADFYHAGLSSEERNKKQENWIQNKTAIIVATNAFGMGIDKADVRIVIHFEISSSLEAYYQEAGRAGRDEKKAFAVALYHKKDLDDLKIHIEKSYPPIPKIREIYQALANYYQIAVGSQSGKSYDFEIADFIKKYQLNAQEAYYSIKILEAQGFLAVSDSFFAPSRLFILADKANLYAFQVANKQFDELFTILLRLYGAKLFTEFVKISEYKIAQSLRISVEETQRYLLFLEKNNILIYSIQKSKPQLTLLTARFDAKQLGLDQKKLHDFKEKELQKVQAVIDYLQNQKSCRSVQLSSYFGEKNAKECGICDFCLKDASVISYKQAILAILEKENLDTKTLKTKISPTNDAIFEKELKQLIDTNKIVQKNDGYLYKK